MNPRAAAPVLRRYCALLYVALLCMLASYWPQVSIDGAAAWTLVLAATTGYAALYVLLAMLPCMLLALLMPQRLKSRAPVLSIVAASGGSLMLLAVYADYRLYALYQYHVNGFVLNLLTTPGGIAALGATRSTELTAMLQIAAILALNLGALGLLWRARGRGPQLPAKRTALALFVLLGVLIGEEGVYAWSVYTGQETLLAASAVIPFHLHSSATTLFSRLGVERQARQNLRIAHGTVVYPQAPVKAAKLRADNVVVLVAESFRWDLLTPQITPNLWKFAQRATRYEHHYSGGNRTRMGLFSLFYGLYAPYWYSFEAQRVAPVLMNVLRRQHYQIRAHTSQSFDYPELRHTVFAGVPETDLEEIKDGEPWRRDVRNIDDLDAWIDRRDPKRPFFSFMFFESTHAPYSFPEDHALRSDYLRDMNYIDLDLRNNIGAIHNRYVNAAHHVDQQVGRLIAHLEKAGLMDQTVLLFTGDHGEEFMEKGHWGHGHGNTFPEEQVRVPLILWRPGVAPAVVAHRTSHLQVAPTLLAWLGVTQSPHTYSSAETLDHTPPYLVFGGYDYAGIDDGHHKIVFPFTGSDYFHYSVYDEDDHPVARNRRDAIVAADAALLDAVARESRRFVQTPTATTAAAGPPRSPVGPAPVAAAVVPAAHPHGSFDPPRATAGPAP